MKKHLLISGDVQGVGFRHWLYTRAIKNRIYGWVKNKNNGEVEALLIGKDEDVKDMIKQCKLGPTLSNVKQVIIQDYQFEYNNKSFNILKTS